MKTLLKSALLIAVLGLGIGKATSKDVSNDMPEVTPQPVKTFSAASMPPITPSLKVNGKTDGNEVYLKDLDIKVDVAGTIATTTMTMTFQNSTNRMLEGELTFPLPEGATVSGYALDINGKMRQAVPVEKDKGTQVFEEIERRGVDPGLLERVEGNNFRTRIYPFMSKRSRTVSITYEEELRISGNQYNYYMPTDYQSELNKFSLNVNVWQSDSKPTTDVNSGEINFDKQGKSYISDFKRDNYKPSKLISFSLPIENGSNVLMQPASGSYYFMATCVPPQKSIQKEWESTIGIIWDASLSGRERNIESEMALIESIVKSKKNLTIKVALLNHKFTPIGDFKIKKGNWDQLKKALSEVVYDGGTKFSAIDLNKIKAKEYILFSDGLSTLSDSEFVSQDGRQIHCVVSSPKADYSSLKWLASNSGAKFINLNTTSLTDAIEQLSIEQLQFLGIKSNSSVSEVYPSVVTPVINKFSIAGISNTNNTTLTLQFGYGTKVTHEETIKLNASEYANREINAHKMWAQKKIAELDILYDQNKDELLELAQQFGVVTRNTSLIVLETVHDYIRYNINPPAELQEEYIAMKKNMSNNNYNNDIAFNPWAIENITALKTWWNTDYTPKEPKYPTPDSASTDSIMEERVILAEETQPAASTIAFVAPVVVNDEEDVRDVLMASQDEISESRTEILYSVAEERESRAIDQGVIVEVAYGNANRETFTGSAASIDAKKQATTEVARQGKVVIIPIKYDEDYLNDLKGSTDEAYISYLKLREEYGGTPTFYFNFADWFMRNGDHDKAMSVLTSIAELGIENANLYRLLAYRMKEYKEYELEIYLCKKVMDWRPMDPQSFRDYALALNDAGRKQEAIDAMADLMDKPFSQDIMWICRSIEEVLNTELNQMTSTNPELDKSKLDSTLVKNLFAMPVDVRVVINWNMPNTDIDLHVTNPNGTMCYYGNKQTEDGGRLSGDIRRTHGPEQFIIKNATKGKYQIHVNYYGDTSVKLDGPATIMAEIYTNYGRKGEERKVVCCQLSNADRSNDMTLIAEFEF